MEYEIMMTEDELYHFGIKGMKWGVRRFQNKDGSLTNAGKKRYSEDVDNAKSAMKSAKKDMKTAEKEMINAQKKAQWIPTSKNKEAHKKAIEKYENANKTFNDSKTDYKVAKTEAKGGFDSSAKKSKHQTALEEKYRKQGYDEKQAEIMARDRIRTERILVGAAALTVTACAAYAANKYIKERTDTYIKAGDELRRVSPTESKRVYDMFYASTGKHDNERYEGILGSTRMQQTGQAFLKKMSVNKDIKVASQDKAAKIFGELYKSDPEFKRSVEEFVKEHPVSGRNKANVDDLSPRNIRRLYENFNSGLIDIRESGSGADDAFYKRLKEAGYGAIQDINDMKYSGYNAKNPLIIFDDSPGAFSVTDVTKLDPSGTAVKGGKEFAKAMLEQTVKSNASTATGLALLGTAGNATKMYLEDREGTGSSTKKSSGGNNSAQKRYVEQYKKDHPNTKLSDKEIEKMYKG